MSMTLDYDFGSFEMPARNNQILRWQVPLCGNKRERGTGNGRLKKPTTVLVQGA